MEHKAFREFTNYIPCDALVSCAYLLPEFVVKSSDWHVTVELNGRETRGQLVLDHLQENTNNARIIEVVDEAHLKTFLLWICGDSSTHVEIV